MTSYPAGHPGEEDRWQGSGLRGFIVLLQAAVAVSSICVTAISSSSSRCSASALIARSLSMSVHDIVE